MKQTLRNSVKEVYKKSKNNNNNYGLNNSLFNNNNNSVNTSNNINVSKNNTNNKNTGNKNNVGNHDYNDDVSVSSKPFINFNTMLIIFFFIFIASIIGLVIYFKDYVLNMIKNTFFKEETERTEREINELKVELEENQKNKLLIEQELEELRKKHSESSNKKESEQKAQESERPKEETPKKNKKSNEELRKLYSGDQFVKNDGFCYIGTDNNMRQCVEVYNGDICESGDVYNRIDDCLMPNHFKN